jgi:uncharacterized lipoprotein YmbA
MTKMIKPILACLSLGLLGACASHDHQDVYLLGNANKSNAALQSVRDVNVPNSKTSAETSGVRAVNSVKALNEGKTKVLPEQGRTSTGDS